MLAWVDFNHRAIEITWNKSKVRLRFWLAIMISLCLCKHCLLLWITVESTTVAFNLLHQWHHLLVAACRFDHKQHQFYPVTSQCRQFQQIRVPQPQQELWLHMLCWHPFSLQQFPQCAFLLQQLPQISNITLHHVEPTPPLQIGDCHHLPGRKLRHHMLRQAMPF